jgi:hypothetical protein
MLALALLASACSPPLIARSRVQLAVIDRDSGQWLPEYRHRGDAWIPGTPGHRYAVRLTNTSSERVLVVLSVDGVNAVSGETADPAQAGYVLAPGQSTDVNGWRKSLDDVAQFVFTDFAQAYATRTGRPDNVGVIGIAVFDEARPPDYDAPIAAQDRMADARSKSEAAPAAAPMGRAAEGATANQQIGTGHGAREYARVERTEFVRASTAPVQLTQLRYDDSRALAARGIMPWQGGADGPRAFPTGFVADPPSRW